MGAGAPSAAAAAPSSAGDAAGAGAKRDEDDTSVNGTFPLVLHSPLCACDARAHFPAHDASLAQETSRLSDATLAWLDQVCLCRGGALSSAACMQRYGLLGRH